MRDSPAPFARIGLYGDVADGSGVVVFGNAPVEFVTAKLKALEKTEKKEKTPRAGDDFMLDKTSEE
jgi:hypothetical protein